MARKTSVVSPSCSRVLMLHGHGQSGQFFACKTRFLQQPLQQMILDAMRQSSRCDRAEKVRFYYPSAPLPVNPDHVREESIGGRAWGYGNHLDHIGGLEDSIQKVMRIIKEHGPFIGVVGFSAGASIAAIVASFLEKKSICDFQVEIPQPPFEFAVCFSGFKLENPLYSQIYSPDIETPVLHVIADIDTMIDPSLSFRLGNSCKNASFFFFSGAHYVPRSREFLDALNCFIGRVLGTSQDEEKDWEDCEE